MVNVTTFMVATTAMVLGINALDVKAAEQIKVGLEDAQIIPASASGYAAASASVSDIYKAAVESVIVQAAAVKAENKVNRADNDAAMANIFNDILSDLGKFIDSLLHPDINLPSVDLPDIAVPSVGLPNANIGFGIGFGDATPSSSVVKPTPKTTPKARLQHKKRAIYDMDGSYSEAAVPASEASNEYSASDYAAASASVSDIYKAAVESVIVQAAIIEAENKVNKVDTDEAIGNIFEDIVSNLGNVLKGLFHPSIDLSSIDLPDVDVPSVVLPSVNLAIGNKDGLSSSSVAQPTPSTAPKAKLQHEKRAIYDMDGSYSESSASASEASNEYSAQDFFAASASASASQANYVPHAASVKAVLKARRSEAYASASSAWASASASASADEAAISAAPEMWEQVMMRRSADAEVSEEEDQVYSKAQFGFVGDLIGDRIKDEIGKKIGSEIGKNIQSEIGKNIASAIKNIPKTSIDFDALRSSLLEQFSSGTSEADKEEESISIKLPSFSLPSFDAHKTSSHVSSSSHASSSSATATSGPLIF